MTTDLNTDPRSDVSDLDNLDNPHVLLGAYVLGGLSDEDRQAFVSHLSSCPTCREELVSVAWLRRCLRRLGPAGQAQLAAEHAARHDQSP